VFETVLRIAHLALLEDLVTHALSRECIFRVCHILLRAMKYCKKEMLSGKPYYGGGLGVFYAND